VLLNSSSFGIAFVTINTLNQPTIAKAFNPPSMLVGATSSLTLTINNPNASTLTGVSFTDNLPSTPSQMTVATGTQTNTCGGTVTAAVGSTSISLAGGTVPVPSCSITVPVTTAGAGTFVNTTGIITANESGPGVASNPATLIVTASAADLAVTKVAAPNPVGFNSNLTYQIGLSNAGPQSATTVSLTDTLPAGTTFVSATQLSGTPAFTITAPPVGGTGAVTFTAATMTTTDTAQFRIIVLVGLSAGSTITNTATVTSATADPNLANNSATAVVTTPPIINATNTPTPTNTPIFVQNYIVTPVIPTFQNPAAGGLFNPIAKTPTPRPQAVAAAPPAIDPGMPALRPPNTGDAGLKDEFLAPLP